MLVFTSQSEFKFLEQGESAPAGSAVFKDPKALSRELTVQEMDKARSKILGSQVACSLSRDTAAVKLWNLLKMKDSQHREVLASKPRRDPMLGKARIPRSASMVVLNYEPGKNLIRDAIYRSLSRKEKLVIGLLLRDGRHSWTTQEVESIMSAPDTGWDFLAMYFQFRKKLHDGGLLRFVTIEEFLSRTRK